jgi:hypothetical protein
VGGWKSTEVERPELFRDRERDRCRKEYSWYVRTYVLAWRRRDEGACGGRTLLSFLEDLSVSMCAFLQ